MTDRYGRPAEFAELDDHPQFIVWRAARRVPLRWMPASQEGRWDYWREILHPADDPRPCTIEGGHAHAVPTTRREHRDYDDATAQVIELHPCGGNYA